jgi:superfamily II DNA or RNA helicase
MLKAAAACRLGGSELIRGTRTELRALAAAAANVLQLKGTFRDSPIYPPLPVRAPTAAARAVEVPLLSADELSMILPLTMRREREPPEVAAARVDGGAEAVDSVVNALSALSLDEDETGELLELPDDLGGPAPAVSPLEDRPYQTEAIAACLRELAASRKTILQMACRCGKTKVAHGVIAKYFLRGAAECRVLFLVPGLALLRQTAAKLDSYGLEAQALFVGSDQTAYPPLRALRASEGGLTPTTDPALIARVCGGAAPLLVVSTYQSSPLLLDCFDLIIFDEAHRACGDAKHRPFTKVLLDFERGARLYMTATPRYDGAISMKDRALFGGEAYAYPLRRGIDSGYVNGFELLLMGGGSVAEQVAAAMGKVDKLLVFCRSIRHAVELAGEVRALGGGHDVLSAHSRMSGPEVGAALARFGAEGSRAVLTNCRLFQEGVEIPLLNAVFFAAPRHTPRDIIQSLCRPLNRFPGKPVSKVFLPVPYNDQHPPEAAENMGRFCSILPFFDALMAEDPLLYEHLLDPAETSYPLGWISSAAQTADASDAGIRYSPERLLAAVRLAVRRGSANPKAGERLLRAAKIPWDIGSTELQRIVLECKRYPKTTDAFAYGDATVNYGLYYRYVRDSYAKHLAGEEQPLEPYQLRFLEGLPGWDPYGAQGPYPWKETLATLEGWLAANGGVPPMVDINCGGWVGLDATPLERLSGTLTCCNQGDGRDRKDGKGAPVPGSGLSLAMDKQKDLDELCARWGLRWRKERLSPLPEAPEGSAGSLLVDAKGNYTGKRTFIQLAFDRFKAHVKRHGPQDEHVQTHFPGWPLKHKRQELPEVWARKKEVCPPRWRGRT